MLEEYLGQVWTILLELSPPLLAGLLLAGVLHVLMPPGLIHRALNKPGFSSTFKAVLVGVPLPLCSCGVVPTALGIKREGASNGATTGFLISTPQTGLDSIFVSATFLGWPFAIFKLVAAFITGMAGGLLADRVTSEQPEQQDPPAVFEERPRLSIVAIIQYAIFELFAAIDRWIIAGVLIAAAIAVVMPANFFQELSWAQGMTGMLFMLAISIPLYICTTGSVPIAASFVAAGMPAGTALVFLMAGPATNIATIGAIYRTLGVRLLMVYLGTVIVMSIAFGLTFDFVLKPTIPESPHNHGSNWLSTISALVVIALSVGLLIRDLIQHRKRNAFSADLTLQVEGMTCENCVAKIQRTLERIDGVTAIAADLGRGEVKISGDELDPQGIRSAINSIGYMAGPSDLR